MQFKAIAVVFLYHTLCFVQENFCSSISRNKTARKGKTPRLFIYKYTQQDSQIMIQRAQNVKTMCENCVDEKYLFVSTDMYKRKL